MADIQPYHGQPAVPQSYPDPPEHLKEAGLARWHQMWTAANWLNPDQDFIWIEQLASIADQKQQFMRRIRRDGLMVRGYAPGQEVSHPLLTELRRAEASEQKILTQLGFSPRARAALGREEVQAKLGFAELQRQLAQKRKSQ